LTVFFHLLRKSGLSSIVKTSTVSEIIFFWGKKHFLAEILNDKYNSPHPRDINFLKEFVIKQQRARNKIRKYLF
jgi:hypothetical protein